MTIAEDAQRANDLDTVYMAQKNLAQYFEQTEDAKRTKDKWLADYFYSRCLETGSMVSDCHAIETELSRHDVCMLGERRQWTQGGRGSLPCRIVSREQRSGLTTIAVTYHNYIVNCR
jgi:hypothetical protein